MNFEKDKKLFKMIKLLRENGRMKADDLTKELGLKNARSIVYYKDRLKNLGYNVKSFHGFNGGYELLEEKITDKELFEIKRKIKNDELYEKIERINKRRFENEI